MLNPTTHRRITPPSKQQEGMVLFIALVMLVIMTLGALALVRSTGLASFIAGNLSFQQSATMSGDAGIEDALTFLQNNSAGTTLHGHVTGSGYRATREDPAINQSWDSYWQATLSGVAKTLAKDSAGNAVSYVIQRMCSGAGDPTVPGTGCASVPSDTASSSGGSKGAGVVALQYSSKIYYRVTARIAGPRNTASYLQVIVAL